MAVYLGTATPSAYYLGTAPVSSIYLGSTQVYTTGGGGGSGWTSKSTNFCSSANGWSGGGTSASDKFYKSATADAAFDAAYATVPGAGTVRLTTTSFDCANNWVIYKNGTAAYTFSDNSGDGTGIYGGVIPATGTNSCSITVAAGAVIRFGNTGDHTVFQNVYIWWETA
jgi:hypothetical protein